MMVVGRRKGSGLLLRWKGGLVLLAVMVMRGGPPITVPSTFLREMNLCVDSEALLFIRQP
jgi:hypothetical protein